MLIRITDIPPGEAPQEVRRAWVGIELAVHRRFGKPVTLRSVGVLSTSRLMWPAWLWAPLLGKTTKERGYVVAAAHALERLADHAPDAEQWWQENTPHLYRPMRLLMFGEDVCTPIESNDVRSPGVAAGGLKELKERDQSTAWHRELLVNAIRYAAASPDEQQAVVPARFLDRLGLLHDTLLDPWEHAEAFSAAVRPVLTEAERTSVETFVAEVERNLDPPTTEAADIELSRLRPLAIEIRNRLKWSGDLNARVFPADQAEQSADSEPD